MARGQYGGGAADFVQTVVGNSYHPAAAAAVTMWSAQTGGTRYTDLQNAALSAITSVTTNADGSVPVFYGPDGIAQMWADAGGAERVLLLAYNFAWALPTAPTDGQVLTWNATTGAWGATNPVGNSILAEAENNTGTAQTGLGSGTTNITGCTIVVPASARPVYLWGYFTTNATVAPSGGVTPVCIIAEVSNGVDTPVTIRADGPMTTTTTTSPSAVLPLTLLAASTARTRTFNLAISGLSSGTWQVFNGLSGYRSVVGAMAG